MDGCDLILILEFERDGNLELGRFITRKGR